MMKAKRFTEAQIIKILREGDQEDRSIGEVCRTHGISDVTFYRWRRRFEGMGTADVRKLRELEKENSQLKRLVAERDLEIDSMKELLARNW